MLPITQIGERLSMYIAIKTADSNSEIYVLDGSNIVKQKKWDSGRELSKNLLSEIEKIVDEDFDELEGVIAFVGPGSFTGLRIGISVANALAYAKSLPIVGENGEDWLNKGAKRLSLNENDKIITPEYGGEANITKPKK